ncbi:SDR family oxidoreductase [Paenibacillus sp. JNUCC32]|uniref:SDR family NAD(P)-dependent oxidoreductase n=1 Tax=Paenibacillus TaxID=44249 RepID=UPI001787EC14|nr:MULTISPECIES: SDR family oxidoreductase [Paenibacillus]QOT12461.1 SDR family oxidoreductase [Paenibacillus sp. JNUCC-32]GIP02968.1 oxidoreductase [Paenibacillus lautus]
MDMELNNKTALVTGSTKGIGKAIAMELAREGAHVLINGRNDEEVERTVQEIKSKFPNTSPQKATADLVDIGQREALFEKYPHVDILVNNMGIYEIMSYEDVDDEVWETYFRTNVLAANGLTKFYLPGMLKNDFGRIIFMASEEAVMPSGQMPQYCMTKSMLLSLAKSLSKLTRGTEVTINTIMPGPTLSENVQHIIEGIYANEDMTFSEKEKAFMAANLPQSEIQRFIRPIEIGRLATFLCSPYASAFRGSPIRMDGGMVPTIF